MHVSFRNRLTFFFILLVILPVLAVGFVGLLIVNDSEERNTQDRLDRATQAGEEFYAEARQRARDVAETVESDEELAVAIRDRDRAALQRRLQDLAQRGGAVRVRLKVPGQEAIDVGGADRDAVAQVVGEV